MSTSYSAKLVAGVPYDEIIKIVETIDTSTKFDPDTGVPYQKRLTRRTVLFNGMETDQDPEELYEFEDSELKHVYAFDDKGIIGIPVCCVDDYRCPMSEVKGIEETMAEASLMMPGQNVRLHLVLHGG